MARLADGRVAFASGAFPGDVISPLDVRAKKGFVRAPRFRLVRPSAERVEASCPVVDRCGGCDWMRLGRASQNGGKAEILRQALTRTGGFTDLPEPISITAVGPPLGYRTRVRLHVDDRGSIGFFSRRSRELVEIERCPVCRPELDVALAALRRVPQDLMRPFAEIELRVADEPSRVSVRLSLRTRGRVGPVASRESASKNPIIDVARALSSSDVELDVAGATPGGDADQVFRLKNGVFLLAAPGVFTQVNWFVNDALVAAVLEGATKRGARRFCDAYAGVGNFALPLLAAGLSGAAIERDTRAVECARRAATAQGLDDTVFNAGDTGPFLRQALRGRQRFDLIVLDPPRRGASDVLSDVVALAPEHVLFCSCDPVTLARDLGTLARAGYRFEEVRGFDMFPETHHFETLAWMHRTPDRSA
jgi:23S rRNA (uracil1939-C5)-methyltransferase